MRNLQLLNANWQTFAGGTGAHHGNSYALYLDGNRSFHIEPPHRRGSGYNLKSFNVTAPHWVDHGNFRSPQQAKAKAAFILNGVGNGVIVDASQLKKNPARRNPIFSKGERVVFGENTTLAGADGEVMRVKKNGIVTVKLLEDTSLYDAGQWIDCTPDKLIPAVKKNPARRLRATVKGRKGRVRVSIPGADLAWSTEIPHGAGQGRSVRRIKRDLRKQGIRVNPSAKSSRQIFVTCERGGKTHTLALVKDTPQLRILAKRFAKTYKRKHPGEVVKVSAG